MNMFIRNLGGRVAERGTIKVARRMLNTFYFAAVLNLLAPDF